MTGLGSLIKRNTVLFFKDKGMFFSALITPIILLVLYATFLSNVYADSFRSAMPQGVTVADSVIDAVVGGQLFASLLAVSCITVSFSCNLIMVSDKVTGAAKDIAVTPVRPSVVAYGYYVSTLISTLAVCFTAMIACFIYIGFIDWYFSVSDVLYLFLDVLVLTLFGTALSSAVNFFLSTQGQISAVSAIISAGYGFICGAYMPISQFGEGLQKVISFFPGTYGTVLIKSHAMRGAFEIMSEEGFPDFVIDAMKDSVDCNAYFFDTQVTEPVMYLIVCGWIVALISVYALLNKSKS